MGSTMYGLTPVLLVAAGLGCSGGSTKSSLTDGGRVSEAGAIDVGSDGAKRLDVRDANKLDLSITEAGVARDTRDAGIDTQPRDTKDVGGEALSADTAGNRDSSPDGKRDASLDSKRDGNLDLLVQPDLAIDTAPMRGTCALPIDIPYDVPSINLTVNTSCVTVPATSVNATNTAGVPAPT